MNREEIRAVVLRNMQNIIEGSAGKEILESHSMRDFGADSLEMVEVVSRSMKELKLKVPRTDLSTARNLAELLDLFERAAVAKTEQEQPAG
jgi:acyl carrier protein